MPDHLNRFVDAQAGAYATAVAELARGRKESHWVWFIFPQITGLGFSAMSQRYALSGLHEARAYLAHPLLGPRLHECVELVNKAYPTPLGRVLGSPDDLKFHSCVTLFDLAAPAAVFADALQLWFGGTHDPATVSRLQTS